MRRALLLAAATALLLAACSDGDDKAGSTTSSTERPNQRVEGIPAQGQALKPVAEGKLTVCLDVPNPPFTVEEESRTAGVDAEMMRALGGRLGLGAELRPTPAASLFKDLDDHKCDLVASGVPKTDAEAAARTISDPYLDVVQAVLVRKADEGRYRDLGSLRGRAVGVQTGAPGADVARTEAEIKVSERPDFEQLLADLRFSRVDAVVHDYPLVAYTAVSAPDTALAHRFEVVTAQYVFVMPKGADDFKKALDEALRAIRRDDTYNSIIRRYFGTA